MYSQNGALDIITPIKCGDAFEAHPDKGQQPLFEEAAGLAGAFGDGGQQQILSWPCIRVTLHVRIRNFSKMGACKGAALSTSP
jgi:hypothetical protein